MMAEMRPEQHNLARHGDLPPPPHVTRTVIATHPDAAALLRSLVEAWHVIAGWGRWTDDDVVALAPEAMRDQLPAPLRRVWAERPLRELERWLDDLRDREWTWWSARQDGDRVEITLVRDEHGDLGSFGALAQVMRMLGGVVERKGA
jgi:hypothetical protein